MKSLWYAALLLLTLVGSYQGAWAQQSRTDDGRRAGYWFLGLNSGVAWQDEDMLTRGGGGVGLYLGKNLFYSQTAPLSLDLRFRYLYTGTFGQDYRYSFVDSNDILGGRETYYNQWSNSITSTNNYTRRGGGVDSVFMNHLTHFNDFSLEGRLNFENLRRKYRIWLSLYGGLGVGLYQVKYDQAADYQNIGNDLYVAQYEAINRNQSRQAIAEEISNIRDHSYETFANDLQATLTPSVGFELGYWVAPRIAIGIGHRVTWTLKDDFDGYMSSNRTANDRHHYANLFLHFDFWRARSTVNTDVNNNTNVVTPVEKPVVYINYPNACPFSTNQAIINIRASLRYVNNPANITFLVNGVATNNFRFNTTTGDFEATISLVQGNNTISIQGLNTAGSATQTCNIVYTPVAQPAPMVDITYPSANPFTTNSAVTSINANITHISNSNDIVFTINGQPSRNFSFSGTTFTANNIGLSQGNNTIVITATNSSGNASDNTTIIYQPQQEVVNPPVVTFTTPAQSPYTTNSTPFTATATVLNVSNASQVTFTVNGQPSRNFSFNGTTLVASGINLVQGSNTFTITATNRGGTASATATVIYNPPTRQAYPPTVNITYPAANPFVTNTRLIGINATITNVSNASQVTFTVNGQPNRNFTLNGTYFTANNITLAQGNNTIVITASNNDGTASDNTTIVYEIPAPVTPAPTVDITSPANNSVTNNPITTVTATILNISNASQISFTINGQPSRNFSFTGTSFVANNVALAQGNNNIVITASSNGGNASDNTNIIYQPAQPAIPAPAVDITSPANNSVTNNPVTTVTATVLNVANANQISFMINGQPSRNFTLNGTSFVANNVVLTQGNNNVVIIASNPSGQANDNTNVIYQVPQPTIPAPAVDITSPANNSVTNNPITTVTATVLNVANANQVTFIVNGQPSRNFTLNGTSFVANNIALAQGNNNIVITANNPSGQASDNTNVIYQVPQPTVQPPVVNITNPAQNPATVNTNTTTINATVLNVTHTHQVVFSVNGQPSRNFTLNGTSFVANNVALAQGNNSIVITATNQAGNASDNTTIIYQVPQPTVQPPVVTITTPAQSPSTVSTNTTTINATILNVANANQVTFNVNGRVLRTFALNGTQFTATGVGLQNGNNTITITAANQAGQASDNTVIVYQEPQPTIQPPVVDITNPAQNPSNASSNIVTINATILNVAGMGDVTFRVNGRPSRGFTLNGTNFVANNVSLNNGSNTIEVTATNAAGAATANTVIIYTPQLPPPTVNITTPASNPSTTANGSAVINATINNVSNPNQVTFTVNGQPSRNFTLNGSNFAANSVTLAQGNNNIVITAATPAGNASDNTTIVYAPLAPPTVNITSPTGNPATANNSYTTIEATITNVSSSNDVTFYFNGQQVRNFTLRGNNFTGNVRLGNGNNTVTITATNQAGQASDNTVIIYSEAQPQPTPPSISTINSYQQASRGSSSVTVVATIVNAPDGSSIVFTANGQQVSNFSYQGGQFVANNVPYQNGVNTYTVTVTTAGGTATMSTTLNISAGTSNDNDGSNNNGGNQNRPVINNNTGGNTNTNTGRGNSTTTTNDQQKNMNRPNVNINNNANTQQNQNHNPTHNKQDRMNGGGHTPAPTPKPDTTKIHKNNKMGGGH